ncbi:transmembrane protein 154 isoform X1 [Vicugna pacos]|uniref:Transmembrane protein 154 isoform X1 n=1 Tax=Vicugna pacos TaxID=30538 RepID=A0A6J0AUI7_VICPA|nr:transmembrane protein 154 [Vicugna pacos]
MPGRADTAAPRAALVFALVIASLPSGQAPDFLAETEQSGETPQEAAVPDEETVSLSTFAMVTTESFITNMNSTLNGEDTDQLEFILMVLIPLILLALLLLSVILLATYRKRKKNKPEPSSQGSQNILQTCELGNENLKVPIFEEDTPSVMEIEMEELDKWMNSMNRNADYECLPTLEEEKEPNQNHPSDDES